MLTCYAGWLYPLLWCFSIARLNSLSLMLIACVMSLSSVLTACLSKVISSFMFSLSPHQYMTIRALLSQSVSTEYCLNCVVYSAAECCCLMCWIICIATLSLLDSPRIFLILSLNHVHFVIHSVVLLWSLFPERCLLM